MTMKLSVPVVWLFAFSATMSAQQQNPLIGTWKTNATKTKLHLGPPSSNNVTTIEASGPNGIKYISERTDAQGQTDRIEYTANFDGKTYPYKAPGPNITRDGVAIKQINPNTYQVFYKLKGETVQINYYLVASDGRTMTTVSTGVTADGQVYNRMMVNDKQ